MESATGTLVVRRPPRRRRDALRFYRVDVDGTPRGLLGPGETLVWQLPIGEYRVQARIDWTGSPPVEVGIRDGTPVWLSVEPQRWGRWLLRGLARTGYLRLVEVETGGRFVAPVSDGTELAAIGQDGTVHSDRSASLPAGLSGVPGMQQVAAGRVSAGTWLVVLLPTCVGGLVLATDVVVPLPGWLLLVAAVVGLGGLVSFGVLGFVDGRRSGAGFWSALGRGVRLFLKALWQFFP